MATRRRPTARRAVRKATRRPVRSPSRTKSKGESIDVKPKLSLEKTLRAAKNRELATTVAYLMKHLQNNLRKSNKKEAKNIYSTLTGIAFLQSNPMVFKENIAGHLVKIAKKYRLARVTTRKYPEMKCDSTCTSCDRNRPTTCVLYTDSQGGHGCWYFRTP